MGYDFTEADFVTEMEGVVFQSSSKTMGNQQGNSKYVTLNGGP